MKKLTKKVLCTILYFFAIIIILTSPVQAMATGKGKSQTTNTGISQGKSQTTNTGTNQGETSPDRGVGGRNLTDDEKQKLDKAKEKVDDQKEKDDEEAKKKEKIYRLPEPVNGDGTTDLSNLDSVVEDADSFVNANKSGLTDPLNMGELQNVIGTIYNIALSIGVMVAVVMGGVLGVKYMASSVEGKAEVKTMLVPYAVGCAIVFGAFGIWKLLIVILQQI